MPTEEEIRTRIANASARVAKANVPILRAHVQLLAASLHAGNRDQAIKSAETLVSAALGVVAALKAQS